MSTRVSRLAIAVAAAAGASAAHAGSLTVYLDHEFSGAIAPSGAGPWANVKFEDGGSIPAGMVQITITATLNSSKERIGASTGSHGFYFNLNTALDPMGLGVANVSGKAYSHFVKGTNAFQPDGDGQFDFGIAFGPQGLSQSAPTSVVLISHSSASLSINDIAGFLSVNGPVGKNGFVTAAHVQGIFDPSGAPGNDDGSGWIAPSGSSTVIIPLPTAGAMGLAGLGLIGLRRRREA